MKSKDKYPIAECPYKITLKYRRDDRRTRGLGLYFVSMKNAKAFIGAISSWTNINRLTLFNRRTKTRKRYNRRRMDEVRLKNLNLRRTFKLESINQK